MKEFVIPVHPEDLLIAGDRYSVKDKQAIDSLSEAALRSKLADFADQFKAQPASISTERETFDFIFSCISQFVVLPAEAKNNIVEILNTGLSGSIPMIKRFLSTSNESNEEYNFKLREYKDVIKKYMFLLNWFIQLQDKANADTNAATKTANAAKPKGKGRKGTKKKDDEEEETVWDSEGQKERVLSAVLHSLELDLSRLWKLDVPEEEFINLYSKICYLMLENPANARSKAIKKCIFMIIGQLVKKYNQSFNVVNSVIHMLHNFEHLPPHLAELMEVLVNDYEAHHTLSELMREIGRMSAQDFAQDSSGVKSVATFIAETTERIPKSVLPSISLLLIHLDTESYMMRNGIVQVIGFLICKAFVGEDHSEKGDTRDSLLGILLERLRDTSSYTRSRTLQTWQYLFQERAVPLKMLQPVAEAVTGRLEDKANMVRKNATQLLTTMMQFNPYHAKLNLAFFQEKSKACKALLEEYAKKKKELQNKNENEPDEEGGDGEDEEDEGPPVNLDREKLQQLVDGTPYEAVLGTDATNVYGAQVLNHLRTFSRWSHESAEFIETLHKAVPFISELLGSKNSSDVLEAIQFFVSAKEFGLQTAQDGILKMLSLIFNKEANIKEALVEAFRRLFTIVPAHTKHANYFIAKNLISLTFKANLGELTALEELITELTKNKHIIPAVIQALWDIFAMKIPSFDKDDSRGALMLLTMAANADPEIIRSKLNLVINIGLGPRWKEDQLLAKYACIAVQKIRKKGSAKDGPVEQFGRYPNNHAIFERLSDIVMDLSIPHSAWFSPAEQAINAIFLLSEHPDHICSNFVKTLSALIFLKQKPEKGAGRKKAEKAKKPKKEEDGDEEMEDAEEEGEKEKEEEENEEEEEEEEEGGGAYKRTSSSSLLSRFLFVVGHVALKQLVHIEEIQSEIRKRRQAKETPQSADKTEKKKGKKPADVDNIEKELGTEAAAAETEHELMQEAAERELVSSSLLGRFGPIIVAVCTNAGNKYNDPALQTSAVLALCKFMCVHSAFCEKNLQLIFTILQRSPDSGLRSNIIIALGDLAFRFPNTVEPWTPHMYDRLKDDDARVRKNTLMVLTHLILNDMIRVKGQISEMALCLEDKEQRIADLAHLFFHELSQKGNSLYNILPDAIGKLSIDPRVTPENFDSIMKYLFSFIQKERQSESLVEKMCVRFRATKEPQEWRCIAFCLSLLSYNDKSMKKLSEYFKCYQDKLTDEEILNCFYAIITKTRKTAKAELKVAVDELEQKIAANQKAIDQDDAGGATASTAGGEASGRPVARTKATRGKGKVAAKPRGRTVGKPGRKANRYIESDDDDEDDDDVAYDDESSDDGAPAKKAPARRTPASAKPAARRAPARGRKKEEEEEEEEGEEEGEEEAKGKKGGKKEEEEEGEEEEERPVSPKKRAAPKKAAKPTPKTAAKTPRNAKAPKTPATKRKTAAKKAKDESDEEEEQEEEEVVAPRKSSRASATRQASYAATKKMQVDSSEEEEGKDDE